MREVATCEVDVVQKIKVTPDLSEATREGMAFTKLKLHRETFLLITEL